MSDIYYYITASGEIREDEKNLHNFDYLNRAKHGNFFSSKKEAKAPINRVLF